jgi:hypothetical protein
MRSSGLDEKTNSATNPNQTELSDYIGSHEERRLLRFGVRHMLVRQSPGVRLDL